MKISSRFTIAIHSLLITEYFKESHKITSDLIASSVQVNPVIIRQILGQLKKAKLVEIHAGNGGTKLAKAPAEITLYDIFYAVEALDDNTLFSFHENPNLSCPIGQNIHAVLDNKLDDIQKALNMQLQATTLQDLLQELSTKQ